MEDISPSWIPADSIVERHAAHRENNYMLREQLLLIQPILRDPGADSGAEGPFGLRLQLLDTSPQFSI